MNTNTYSVISNTYSDFNDKIDFCLNFSKTLKNSSNSSKESLSQFGTLIDYIFSKGQNK